MPHDVIDRGFYLSHYPVSASHPGVSRMHDILRSHFYQRKMRNEVSRTVQNCRSCPKTRGSPHRHKYNLKMFQPNGPLEFVTMDILGSLSKTDTENLFVLVVTYRYTKPTKTVHPAKQTKYITADAFISPLVYIVSIPDYLLTDNGSNFFANFFANIWYVLCIQQVNTPHSIHRPMARHKIIFAPLISDTALCNRAP